MEFKIKLPSYGDVIIETTVRKPLIGSKLLILGELSNNDIKILKYSIFLENGKGELVGPYVNDDYIDFSKIETKIIKVIAVRNDDYSFKIVDTIVHPLKIKGGHVTTYRMEYEINGYFTPRIELIANEKLRNNKLIQSTYENFINETQNKIIEYINEKLSPKLNFTIEEKILLNLNDKELLKSTITEVMENTKQNSDLYFEISTCNYRLINSNIATVIREVNEIIDKEIKKKEEEEDYLKETKRKDEENQKADARAKEQAIFKSDLENANADMQIKRDMELAKMKHELEIQKLQIETMANLVLKIPDVITETQKQIVDSELPPESITEVSRTLTQQINGLVQMVQDIKNEATVASLESDSKTEYLQLEKDSIKEMIK